MNYIGSKLSLLDFIKESLTALLKQHKKTDRLDALTFCDLFAGTGITGSYFKEHGMRIIANDLQFYSYVLNRHYIGNHHIDPTTLDLLHHLNQLPPVKGFIYHHYSLNGTQNSEFQRQYFSDENAMFCDAVRQEIERLFQCQAINEHQYYFLLASLIESIDKYANTASVYGAFLKHLKKTASQKAHLSPVRTIPSTIHNHEIYHENAVDLIHHIQGDILYLDPPYNARQYCDNYHVLETIARYDHPEIKGKTGLRLDNAQKKSTFCYKKTAKASLEYIIQHAKFDYILLSYNDEGIITLDEIQTMMSQYGQYTQFQKPYKRFKAAKKQLEKNETIEYLHCLVK